MTTEQSAAAFSWQLLPANWCNDDPAVYPAGLWRTFYRINASVKVRLLLISFQSRATDFEKERYYIFAINLKV